MASDGSLAALVDRASACAQRLRAADRVLVVSHIDADGLTSAAIASRALERAGIAVETRFANQLDSDAIDAIAATDYETVLFTDFGSGQLDLLVDRAADGAFTPVIADHHQPADATTEFHLNPLLVGLDGATELSGAGTTYVLARALAGDRLTLPTDDTPSAADATESTEDDATGSPRRERETTGDDATGSPDATADGGVDVASPGRQSGDHSSADNRDLAALAVVGAVGDMQAGVDGLRGANEVIVAEGVAAGVLDETTDLSLYGKQTRPLPKLLEYASEARIPGISNDEGGAFAFLSGLDVEVRADGEWRCWADLRATERQTVLSALIQHAVDRGVPADRIDDLVGTGYELTDETPGTALRDASEFSTLLNATARYERGDVGLAVCLGDRADALEAAHALLRTHRRNLSSGLQWVREEGVTSETHIQWFDAGSTIRETIVGIVAGMAVGAPGIDRDRPIVAIAEQSDTERKVSARATHGLTRRGLDLSVVMREAARSVGGDGGGHDVAAGATIPAGTQPEFIAAADRLVGEQLGEST